MPIDNSVLYKNLEGYQRMQALYVEGLTRITVPYMMQQIRTPSGETNLLLAGDENAPPVVMLHGHSNNLMMWAKVINHLSTDFRCIVVDIPGHTGRSAPTIMNGKDESHAQWMTAILNALDYQKVQLVGTSHGAWIALRLASQKRQKIQSLFLLSSAGFIFPTIKFLLQSGFTSLTTPSNRIGRQIAKSMAGTDFQPDNYVCNLATIINQDLKSLMLARPRVESNTLLSGIVAPTCLYMGAEDPLFNPEKVIKRAQARLANLLVAEALAGIGHTMLYESPDLIAQHLHNWLVANP